MQFTAALMNIKQKHLCVLNQIKLGNAIIVVWYH